jgi:hypothetical protein
VLERPRIFRIGLIQQSFHAAARPTRQRGVPPRNFVAKKASRILSGEKIAAANEP